jgi:hypothetical protein
VVETILNEGRSLGIYLILMFHNLAQVAKVNPALLATVLTNCRTKIIGGGLTQPDLEVLTPELFVRDWHPHLVRQEIRGLEVEPVETTRMSLAVGRSQEESQGTATSRSATDTLTDGTSHATHTGIGVHAMHTDSQARMQAETRGRRRARRWKARVISGARGRVMP